MAPRSRQRRENVRRRVVAIVLVVIQVHSTPKKNQPIVEKEKQQMKSITVVGIVLVVLGALALAYQGITYTRTEEILDVGPIHATHETRERIPIPPVLGGIALVAGVALLVVRARRKA